MTRKSAIETAIKNQLAVDHINMYAEHVGPINVVRFVNLNAAGGPGALMIMLHENPGATRKHIVELMHERHHTTGQYTTFWGSLQRAKVIGKTDHGFVLTKLGERILKEANLIK